MTIPYGQPLAGSRHHRSVTQVAAQPWEEQWRPTVGWAGDHPMLIPDFSMLPSFHCFQRTWSFFSCNTQIIQENLKLFERFKISENLRVNCISRKTETSIFCSQILIPKYFTPKSPKSTAYTTRLSVKSSKSNAPPSAVSCAPPWPNLRINISWLSPNTPLHCSHFYSHSGLSNQVNWYTSPSSHLNTLLCSTPPVHFALFLPLFDAVPQGPIGQSWP